MSWNPFRQKRYPMDERLPDGSSVDDLLRAAQANQQEQPSTIGSVIRQRLARPTPQNPIPQAAAPADALPQGQPNIPFPDANAVRQRRTQPRDYIADDEAYLRDLEKNKGSFWKRLAAAGIRAGQAATHQEISPILTSREQDIADTTNRLGRELTVAQKRQQIEQGQMVPFQLPDGSWTYAPMKQVATLGSRQQNQQATLSIRRQQMEAHNKRWDTMGKHEAAQDAQRLYNSGAADDNEDLRDEIATRMGLPQGTRLPPHTQGQIRVDEQGNYVLVNPRTGAVSPTATGSYQKTAEEGRNRRFDVNQNRLNNPPAKAPTLSKLARPDGATVRRAAKLVSDIDDARASMEDADKKGDAGAKARAQRKGELAASELNALGVGYEAGKGEGGYPYYKQNAQVTSQVQQSGITESQIREAAKAKGLDPDTAVQRARARKLIP